jgi:hypothetical protein
VFFQKEEDSVERLAVAIMPVKDLTCADLMQKIRKDLYSYYAEIDFPEPTEQTFAAVPALLATFSAVPNTNPGTHTQSVVLAFVRAGRAYVISARTFAAKFKARQTLLESLVKSFQFTTRSQARSQ